MRLATLRDDLDAILLTEIPASFRLAILILTILTSHALGLAWYFAGIYEREAVRAEVQGDYVELREQVRSLWESHQAMREWRDRVDLVRRR